MSQTADGYARELAKEALDVIRDEMRNPLNEAKDRIKAAEALLERGHGKPTQAIIAIPASRRVAEAAAQMTDEELISLMKATPLPRLAAPVIDAEFSEVDPLLK